MHAPARLSGRALGALLALLVVAATLLAPSPAQAAVSGTLTTSRAEAMPGEQLTVNGTLPPSASRSVTLQRRLGTGAWSPVSTKKSLSTGAFSFAVTAPTSVGTLVSYRVVAPQVRIGTTTYPATETPTRSLRVVQQAGTLSGPTAAQVGTPSTYAASFTPARSGRAVKLERLVGSTWTAIGAAKPQDATGAASFTFTPTATGSVQLRAYTLSYRGVAGRASNKLTVTVTSTDSTPPAAPTGLAADPGDGQVELTWDTVTAGDLAGYRVYYATDAGGPWTQSGTLSTGNSRTVTGLTNGTQYAFAVTAEDTTGNESDRSTSVESAPVAPMAIDAGVATGAYHSCRLKATGALTCWGDNADGQVGNGTRADQPVPTSVPSTPNWAVVEAGISITCGIKTDRTAWCWGDNGAGRLGNGTNVDKLTPTQVGTDEDWTSIRPNAGATCATKQDGSAWCWGFNAYGNLGDGGKASSTVPVQVSGGDVWREVSPSSRRTCGVQTDGSLWCWGFVNGGAADQTSPTQVEAAGWSEVGAGEDHFCGVKTTGSAWCWGSNFSGQLGDGTTTTRTSPTPVAGSGTWLAIAPANGRTCGIKSDASAWCWGSKLDGGADLEPAAVDTTATFDSIDVGTLHTCGFASGGTALCWGLNADGQLGDGRMDLETLPVQVGDRTDWASVTGGEYHTCAVRADGTAWCWGLGEGLGFGEVVFRSVPRQVGTDTDWASLSANERLTCGLKTTGTAWCWGDNEHYQIGDGTQTDRLSPTQVGTATSWAQLSAGDDLVCGVQDDGGLWCWGYDPYGAGQLQTPTRIGTDANWEMVDVGRYFTCATKTTGTAWCWGVDSFGQLGDGSGGEDQSNAEPTQVGSGADWTSVSAGDQHACGTRGDGELWCWGRNRFGETGNAFNPETVASPVRVGTDDDWSAAWADNAYSCGLRDSGEARCFGINTFGRFGNGTDTNGGIDGAPVSGTGWATLGLGGQNHTCGVKSTGTLWCWGSNSNWALGYANIKPVPQAVLD